MKGLWESKCPLCGLPLADHTYRQKGEDELLEWVERQWICPDGVDS